MWSDLMEAGLTQDQEDGSCSVATLGCVCTNSGWSIHMAQPFHFGFSPHVLLPASPVCPYCVTDDLCADQGEKDYDSSVLSPYWSYTSQS